MKTMLGLGYFLGGFWPNLRLTVVIEMHIKNVYSNMKKSQAFSVDEVGENVKGGSEIATYG